MAKLEFPATFRFGASSAAQSSEGAPRADGREDSIWDVFAAQPDRIRDASLPFPASDSHRRAQDDVALLRSAGATSYCFSLAWPRILPRGSGRANAAALDHYGRLVDALLAAGIRPLPTLYHWDLPQRLEQRGGWPLRDTAGRFADYAHAVARALGDRVDDWLLFADPLSFALRGYGTGTHAPGRADPAAFWRATHVINLAQAEGARALRAERPALRVGTALGLWASEPARDLAEDLAAAARWQRLGFEWFSAPLRGEPYPDLALAAPSLEARLDWRDGDEERLRAPLDFLGVALRQRLRVRCAPGHPLGLDAVATAAFRARDGCSEADDPERARALGRSLVEFSRANGGPPIEVSASAVARADEQPLRGSVDDAPRIDCHARVLAALGEALAQGVDLRSYHVWSLLDGFEWEAGTARRCGLVHVDPATGERTPKRSAGWLARVAAERGLAV